MPAVDRAIVVPLKEHEWTYQQSRYAHIPKVPFRYLVSGKSASGKGVLAVNAVTNFYHQCFKKIFVFASSVEVDSTWKAIDFYIQRQLGQNRGQHMYNKFDERALRTIVDAQKLDIQRQKDDPDRKGPLKGCLLIFDDLSHDSNLRRMHGGVLSELMTTGRHYGISIWCNVHSINSLGSLSRRQASAICVFPIANYREKEAIREQYGQLAGSLRNFDAIMDAAIGPDSEPYSFLTIKTDAKTAKRTFLLRLESWLEPIDDVLDS
jgi:hypothetical protein